MRRLNTAWLKNLWSTVTLTAGFTAITAGFWDLFGSGVGKIVGGFALLTLQWWCDRD